MDEIMGWLVGRLPGEWFAETPQVSIDRDEILVVGRLPEPTIESLSESVTDSTEPTQRAAEAGRIKRFREETRAQRMQIADEAELRFGRKVAWGAVCGESRQVFTSLSVPVMTRLRQRERQVLDTLVDAGVARSRSDALAWSVRLVGQHQGDWIEQLREALVAVEAARAEGPAS
ncbi:MAG: hypothetical protein M3423_06250 [Actinomycetota bacterium]|nr:hypothetical protein [Nocardioidaceae bacterium]MDQ3480917.1 hypothetical protein [Actinomycetota bacterium]